MCSIENLKNNGYTVSSALAGTDPLKCIKVTDFKKYISKPNTSLSVKDRTDNRLFPLKDIVEIDTTPSIIFGQSEYNIYYTAQTITNTFTANNITGLTASVEKVGTTGMTGGASVSISESNGKIIVNIPKNEFATVNQFIVTVTGNRIDGETSNTSFSFTINQGFQLIHVSFSIVMDGTLMQFTNSDGEAYNASSMSSAGESTYLMPYGTSDLTYYPLILTSSVIEGASEAWTITASEDAPFYITVLGYNSYDNPLVPKTLTTSYTLKFSDYKDYDDYTRPFNVWIEK